MFNIKIFIPHYSKLVDRKPIMREELDKHGLKDYVFYLSHDKEEIDEAEFSQNEGLIRSKIHNFIPEQVIKNFLRDGLTQGEKSLALKHKNIYKEFLESKKAEEFLLILEDDARLSHNFKNILEKLCSKASFDCLNFSGGSNKILIPSNKQNLQSLSILEVKQHPFNTGTEGYLMSRECVRRVYDAICQNKLCLPIDWELSYIFMNYNIACARTVPPLTYQASMVGDFISSIRDRGADY
jgi:GR25 family glycosyltransferase involved in LPS biosynthesis